MGKFRIGPTSSSILNKEIKSKDSGKAIEVIKEVEKVVEIIKEVKIPVEVIKQVEVIKLVPKEVIKEVVKEVPVIKEVIKEVPVIKELHHVKFQYKLPKWPIAIIALQVVIIAFLLFK